jgi:peptidyl-prolyl cis-trans isomerase C
LGCLLLAAAHGCGGNAGSGVADLPDGGATVASIDGESIPASLLLATAKAYRLDLAKLEDREEALRRLTDFVVLAHVAEREDFAKDPQFAASARLGQLQAIAAAAMHVLERRANIDEAAVRATYERQAGKDAKVAWDFTQLLFDDEDLALRAEGDLIAGKSFADVFDAYRQRARQARTFTGVNANRLPAALAQALGELDPGEATRLPVQTPFGWHVVHLDATRPFVAPPLADVEDGIRRSLARSFAETRLTSLREKAKVTRDATALSAAANNAAAANDRAAAAEPSRAAPSGVR